MRRRWLVPMLVFLLAVAVGFASAAMAQPRVDASLTPCTAATCTTTISVVATPLPVSTPAPCATPACNSAVWQGTSPWVVTTPAPAPTGTSGAVSFEAHAFTHTIAANPSSTAVVVKAAAGTLGSIAFWNGGTVTNFIQVFDKLAASITLGTTAPDKILACPTLTMCFLPLPAAGVAMTTGITLFCTTGATTATGCATGTQLMTDYLYHAIPCAIRGSDEHLRIGPTRDRWRLALACGR